MESYSGRYRGLRRGPGRTARQTCLRPRVLRGVSVLPAYCGARQGQRTRRQAILLRRGGDGSLELSGLLPHGSNKFGPLRGPWRDHEWQGWWGNEPPFHTAVFVMTHHERPSFTLSDTTFHFVDGDPATILERAREAAQGKDVRLGGGATSSGNSSTRTSSTPSMWRCPRGWSSAPDRACGSHLRSCSTGSTMRLCRAPAA